MGYRQARCEGSGHTVDEPGLYYRCCTCGRLIRSVYRASGAAMNPHVAHPEITDPSPVGREGEAWREAWIVEHPSAFGGKC